MMKMQQLSLSSTLISLVVVIVVSIITVELQQCSAWTTTTTTTTTTTRTATTSSTTTTFSRMMNTPLSAATNSDSTSSRRDWLLSSAFTVATTAASVWGGIPAKAFAEETTTKTLPNGVTYVINQVGTGPEPQRGELVAIRFRAYCGDNKIDDIFETPEPYYTRVGSGGLLPGVEQALPYMKVGDRWTLTIPSSLAFGPKGRPASAGKPRIPGDATIVFEVAMEGLPGREPELIELIGDV